MFIYEQIYEATFSSSYNSIYEPISPIAYMYMVLVYRDILTYKTYGIRFGMF